MYELTGIEREKAWDEKPKRVLIARADNETEAKEIRRQEAKRYLDIRRVRIA